MENELQIEIIKDCLWDNPENAKVLEWVNNYAGRVAYLLEIGLENDHIKTIIKQEYENSIL